VIPERIIFVSRGITVIAYVSTTVFITQGNYTGYMFRLLNSHLQAYSLQLSRRMLCTHWDPRLFTSVKYLNQIICLEHLTFLGKYLA